MKSPYENLANFQKISPDRPWGRWAYIALIIAIYDNFINDQMLIKNIKRFSRKLVWFKEAVKMLYWRLIVRNV